MIIQRETTHERAELNANYVYVNICDNGLNKLWHSLMVGFPPAELMEFKYKNLTFFNENKLIFISWPGGLGHQLLGSWEMMY